ncbi:formylglycine-generating enzyme family protein [Chitinispirillales bacterium ANBcel5]|uniref:formylglycine-generating enzyme family protein n=1 Tax=Cellulosispirillum alkaliphilum TaxID=3039283 RepID=UPI002A5746F0|nr:formylglycine-generating enzyme family protein [Chitinispirillales bacterium ANBcel5]
MFKKLSFLLTLLLFIPLRSQEVNISGTIVDDNAEPVTDALVMLKNNPDLKAYSNEVGAFLLSDNVSSVSNSLNARARSFNVAISNNILSVEAPSYKGELRMDILKTNGAVAYSASTQNQATAVFSLPRLSQGLYLLRLTTPQKSDVVRMVNPGSGSPYLSANGRRTISGSNRQAQSAEPDDTLMIFAGGYRNYSIQLSTVHEPNDLTVTLTRSNPWIPAEELMYSGNQVKIMADGYDFEMGQPYPEIIEYSSDWEQPVRTVTFNYDFWMDTVEVTQREYEEIMRAAYDDYQTPHWNATYGLGDDYPVYTVTAHDAMLFCNAKSKLEGLDTVYSYSSIGRTPGSMSQLFDLETDYSKNGYRLPTEAEWEYACRAGTYTDFYWGNISQDIEDPEIDNHAVWRNNSWDLGSEGTSYGTFPVASKPPNDYGLYDMSGNVSEYVGDFFEEYPWGDDTDPTGPADGVFHGLRGGNWGNSAFYLRSSNREFMAPDYEYYFIGFRTVRRAD